MTQKIAFILALLGSVMLPAQDLSVVVIRVSFESDSSPATTGSGQFVLEDDSEIACPEWTLDPAPHDRIYFEDHLQAAHNYWSKVSNGNLGINLAQSAVYPTGLEDSYPLSHPMLYYHPYQEEFDETEKLMALSRDALALADGDIDFSQFTTVMIVHAGMGGDFAFALDPTPGNIPSAYLSQTDFADYGNLQTTEKTLTDVIIIPESQNFLQYEETRTLFEDASDPCFYQVGLNGTIALMLGFHLGLPPLYNSETGRSLVGGFALMDQGSNNFHGIVPAFPDAYSRVRQGWVGVTEAVIGDDINLAVADQPVRVNISEQEYYLIENRQRNLITPDGMIEWIDTLAYDTVSVLLSTGGVVLNVDEQHAGLPGNGLFIWHVDESAWYTPDNPNGGPHQLVDFVEADGAQDMGYTTQLLFADYLETGWWFDPWYAGNEGYFHLNRNVEIVGDSLLTFGIRTRPSTVSNNGTPSHLSIENISRNGAVMSFSVRSARVVPTEAISNIIGWSTADYGLWGLNIDSTEIIRYAFGDYELLPGIVSPVEADLIVTGNPLVFRHPWIGRNHNSGIQLRNILTGDSQQQFDIENPFDMTVTPSRVIYFAEKGSGHVQVNWSIFQGSTRIDSLQGYPLARFQTQSGITAYYQGAADDPIPVGIHLSDENGNFEDIPAALEVLRWSNTNGALQTIHLPGSETDDLTVPKPLHIIPFDADGEGVYEIGLFYEDRIQIINQSGVSWDGNPLMVEPYFGNPIVATISSGVVSIFLRHSDSYALYALDGQILERGVLSQIDNQVANSLRPVSEGNLLLTGQELLYFPNAAVSSDKHFWTDPQGNPEGSRIVKITVQDQTPLRSLKKSSVYNYPNPIKGSSTTIRAWLGDVDTWTIEIFSLSGAQLVSKELQVLQPNAHNEWIWDASDISNGLFVAKVAAGGESQIIKIAIIR